MSQRRGGASSQGSVVKGALSLDAEETEALSTAALEVTTAEAEEKKASMLSSIRQWKESAFACALTEPTWEAERQTDETFWEGERRRQRYRRSHKQGRNNNSSNIDNNNTANDNDDDNSDGTPPLPDFHPDTTGCLCCSALVCPLLGASRVGNMAVLHSTTEWVEHVDEDPESGETKVKRFTRPKLQVVVGPYWPMLVFVTYPLILIVSVWAFKSAIWPGKKPLIVVLVWLLLTLGLIAALTLTGCRDPGILYRQDEPPPQFENAWRWNDATRSYRPRGAHFDSDTAVVVEEFDHTCPWTGTAIGKKNMLPFQFFVCLVFVCLIVDIFLITGAF